MEQIDNTNDNCALEQSFLLNLLIESIANIQALQTKNEDLQNIIELLPGNFYWKNLQGTVLGCNNNLAIASGKKSPADLIGKSLIELYGQELAETIQKHDDKIIEWGKEYNYEEVGIGSDNLPATYLSKKIPLFNSAGQITGTLGISFDITERKKMEEELKIAKEKAEISNRVKSQFVAVVNHELRTPLASIIGLADLLKEDNLHSCEREKIVGSIENSAQHLLNLVNDILDFSKLETSKQPLQITPVNFLSLLNEVFDLLNPLAKNKDLRLLLDTHPDLPGFLLSDARILRHLLINLASNAIKYTEKGQVTIKVSALNQSAQHVQLKISISDTGPGIPADKIETIFKPFSQLTHANMRPTSRNGTGLGLAIVKKLAEMIEAKIQVESELGIGSTFSFTADFGLPEEIPTHTSLAASVTYKKNQSHKTCVLVVEDDPIIQYIHKKLLTNLECEVDVVPNATEALKKLNHHHDIIFSDNNLPDLNGYELIKKIRQTTAFSCPIVIISAFLDKPEEIACLEAGASAFINKPISQTMFKELLDRHCYVEAVL